MPRLSFREILLAFAVAGAVGFATMGPAPRRTPAVKTDALIASRQYEQLFHGRRAATIDVLWTRAEHEGEPAVLDVSRFLSRTVRDMAGHREEFQSETVSTTLRTDDGILLSMETVVRLPSRTDRTLIRRTGKGYSVLQQVGDNEEKFDVPTDGPATLDAESFLGPRIRKGEATAGATFTYPMLDTHRRRLVPSTLKVVGQEEKGLRVEETAEGSTVVWWFAPDGSVVAQRAGDSEIRRADGIDPEDLPRAPAVFPVTMPADRHLPRIFTTRSMVVDILVKTDETVQPPQIPENPFTEVLERRDDSVRVRCLSYDDPHATLPLPIAPEGLEEYLEATPLMEVDDYKVQAVAKRVVGSETDARRAAARLADFVFQSLDKGSPDIPEPTAKRILEERVGDCSEHALLFTTLCRAAGIPARRCRGWVCIGSDWGSHAWCEIWLGKWIGADPTTNEIGTRARYIFTGRQDDRDIRNTVIHPSRTRLLIRRAEYEDGTIDFEADADVDPVVLTGIRFGPLPPGWRERRSSGQALLMGPGITIYAGIRPDHGYRTRPRGFEDATFGGRKAYVVRNGGIQLWQVPLGREHLDIRVQTGDDVRFTHEELEALFRPTVERGE